MAIMIPDSIPDGASQGEKTVYAVLRDKLSDNFIVWYEPRIKTLYPDFVILSPDLGLLILEVKGWYPGNIERASNDFFHIRWQRNGISKVEAYASPLKQGHGYFAAVSDKLMSYPVLCHPDGNYKGRLAFPIGVGAVMSNMTEAQAREHNIYPVLEKPQVAYRDELLEWENLSDRLLLQRLKEMFTVRFPFYTLTRDQISTLKGVLYPEKVVKEDQANPDTLPPEVTTPLPPNSHVLVTLDFEQEKLAGTLGEGHRLFSGVAGSGKTLILLARAKALANRMDEHRILILCFNITLASYLRSLLHSDDSNPQYRERIEVMHFNDWAKSILGSLPSPTEIKENENYDEVLGNRILTVLNKQDSEEKWDTILVDEAHTFAPNWFKCCVAAVKEGEDGSLMIVNDISQSLYKRRKFTWISVGVKAQGRSKKLDRNYRNTQEILTAAWNIVPSSLGETEEDPTFPIVEPSAALRNGKQPVLYLAKSKASAVKALVDRVRSLCNFGYAPSDIAILYRYIGNNDQVLFQDMMKQLKESGLETYWVTENKYSKQNYSVRIPGVRIVTALSSLGLEFKVVLILWADQFWDCCSDDVEKAQLARKQLYVAMTRAQDELHLFGSGSAQILRELEASQGFEVVRER